MIQLLVIHLLIHVDGQVPKMKKAGDLLKEGALEALSLPDRCRQSGKQHDLYLDGYFENPLPDSAGGGFSLDLSSFVVSVKDGCRVSISPSKKLYLLKKKARRFIHPLRGHSATRNRIFVFSSQTPSNLDMQGPCQNL